MVDAGTTRKEHSSSAVSARFGMNGRGSNVESDGELIIKMGSAFKEVAMSDNELLLPRNLMVRGAQLGLEGRLET